MRISSSVVTRYRAALQGCGRESFLAFAPLAMPGHPGSAREWSGRFCRRRPRGPSFDDAMPKRTFLKPQEFSAEVIDLLVQQQQCNLKREANHWGWNEPWLCWRLALRASKSSDIFFYRAYALVPVEASRVKFSRSRNSRMILALIRIISAEHHLCHPAAQNRRKDNSCAVTFGSCPNRYKRRMTNVIGYHCPRSYRVSYRPTPPLRGIDSAYTPLIRLRVWEV